MPGTTDPPRPGIVSGVKTYIEGCTWDAQDGRVENGGVQIFAWLNQAGNPSTTVPVQWEVGTAAQAGSSVPAAIPQDAYDAIKNGTLNTQTGVITYQSKNYRFRFIKSGSDLVMERYSV